MANNDKISIDVEISASGQQQLNQYNRALDGLRMAINNLSTPLNVLDKNLSRFSNSVNKLNEENISLDATIKNVATGFGSFRSIIQGLEDVLKLFKLQAAALNTTLTGGIGLVLAFLPEIINLVTCFFKGKGAVAQMTDKLKGFNEIMKAANSDTATQTAKLNLLYKAATDVKKSDEARAESIKLLNKEFPGYFEHLSTEAFKNGKANETYFKLTQTIIENAKAKAALNKITEESAKILDAEHKTILHLAEGLAIAA
ncbi:hypothetical protein [Mucilaginibacter auburnensis]|uniref:Uncharacterized protein n=1 Tax=Mucilaginibacter auburnensis TaxID=1457233 RepID=A0A2H9VNS7_9SPHI|nr:hypothetical protein [Mucilaginibacter auburnensis]PJJ79963.1 hypothetical protein CLV57_3102 [Mucilaginibacter auburnensis]